MSRPTRIERAERDLCRAQERFMAYYDRMRRSMTRMHKAKKDMVRLDKLLRRLWAEAVEAGESLNLPGDPDAEGGG